MLGQTNSVKEVDLTDIESRLTALTSRISTVESSVPHDVNVTFTYSNTSGESNIGASIYTDGNKFTLSTSTTSKTLTMSSDALIYLQISSTYNMSSGGSTIYITSSVTLNGAIITTSVRQSSMEIATVDDENFIFQLPKGHTKVNIKRTSTTALTITTS